jgi:GMP synthase (glutamine-hydrolysing)
MFGLVDKGIRMRNVIVLQHAESEGPGTLSDALAAPKLPVRVVRGDLGERIPSDLSSAAALIVMGGPMGVYEHTKYPFLRDELRLVEAAVKAHLPVVGICLGSQLLATALGANVRQGSRKEIGWYSVHLEPAASADTLFTDAPNRFEGFHWHGDIFDLPYGAIRLAHSDLTECQAFRYGSAHGILFHMEVTQASIAGMVQAFPAELAQAGESTESLASGTNRHLERLQSIGATVFRRWVDTIQIR